MKSDMEKRIRHTEYMKEYRKGEKHRQYRDSLRCREILRKNSDKYFETHLFGGNRLVALSRDGYRCVNCGISRDEHYALYDHDICVHHIDGLGKGVGVGEKNNSLDNLETLCLKCHAAIHSLGKYERKV